MSESNDFTQLYCASTVRVSPSWLQRESGMGQGHEYEYYGKQEMQAEWDSQKGWALG